MGNSCCRAENLTAVKSSTAFFDELPPGVHQCTVDHVYDGDTLTICEENRARVRLLGIDAPERKGGEPYAKEATDFLKRICPVGGTVWLDKQSGGQDRYGRKVALVFVPNPSGESGFVCANIALLEQGLATFYNPLKAKLLFEEHMLSAQQRAIRGKLNIWRKKNLRELVFCTPNGIAFHAPDCPTIERTQPKNLQRLPMSQALENGLSPCRQCKSTR